VPVRFKSKDGLVLLDQIRTVDKQRLVKCVGQVSASVLTATLDTLCGMFQR